MDSGWITGLAAVLAVAGSVPSVQQLVRSARVRTAAGWDPAMAWAWASSYFVWTWYSVHVGVPAAVWVNALGVLAMGVVLVLLRREHAWGAPSAVGWTV